MLCEVCSDHPATVHLTQVLDGKVRELHLCEVCAEKAGVNVQNAMSLPDVLLGMGPAEDEKETGAPERSCPSCHLRKSDFKKTSRLGCPACYETFAAELEPLLASMHKGSRHIGKVPAAVAKAPPEDADLTGLQKSLDAAVAAENFEEAARVRDLIRNARARTAPPEAGGEKAAP